MIHFAQVGYLQSWLNNAPTPDIMITVNWVYKDKIKQAQKSPQRTCRGYATIFVIFKNAKTSFCNNRIPKIMVRFCYLTLSVPIVTNINFLLTISIRCQDKSLRELVKWSPNRNCYDLLFNSLNLSLGKCMNISMENLYVDIWACKDYIFRYWSRFLSSVATG